LRRTAIKDLTGYCGFLIGFLGSAPFAWGYLAAELERGSFARGLWYFFAIVFSTGVFAGTAGLATGFVIGWIWEQYHRRRRRERSRRKESLASAGPDAVGAVTESEFQHETEAHIHPAEAEVPRLRLVTTTPDSADRVEGEPRSRDRER